MRVAAHTEHAGLYMAVLRHHHMADALAVVNVGQVLLARPVARNAYDAARLVVTFRHIVVHHQYDTGFVPDLRTQFFQHGLEPARARRVVEHCHVDLAGHDLAGRDRRAASRSGDQFLRKALAHVVRLVQDHRPR